MAVGCLIWQFVYDVLFIEKRQTRKTLDFPQGRVAILCWWKIKCILYWCTHNVELLKYMVLKLTQKKHPFSNRIFTSTNLVYISGVQSRPVESSFLAGKCKLSSTYSLDLTLIKPAYFLKPILPGGGGLRSPSTR